MAFLIVALIGLVIWLSWVAAMAWWLQGRGWRALQAWPASFVTVIVVTWLITRLMYVDALSPLTPLFYFLLAGPIVAPILGTRYRQRRRRGVDQPNEA